MQWCAHLVECGHITGADATIVWSADQMIHVAMSAGHFFTQAQLTYCSTMCDTHLQKWGLKKAMFLWFPTKNRQKRLQTCKVYSQQVRKSSWMPTCRKPVSPWILSFFQAPYKLTIVSMLLHPWRGGAEQDRGGKKHLVFPLKRFSTNKKSPKKKVRIAMRSCTRSGPSCTCWTIASGFSTKFKACF